LAAASALAFTAFGSLPTAADGVGMGGQIVAVGVVRVVDMLFSLLMPGNYPEL
jgi:hypothetical protein